MFYCFRRYFRRELLSNKIVRLIYKGKILTNDEAVLRTFRFTNNSVLHCVICHIEPTDVTNQNDEQPSNTQLSRLQIIFHFQQTWKRQLLLITLVILAIWFIEVYIFKGITYIIAQIIGNFVGSFLPLSVLAFMLYIREQRGLGWI